jgi:gas vesicle protein
MTYPTDAKMLRKLGMLASKVSKALRKFLPETIDDLAVDIKGIALKARNCFFQKRYATREERSDNLQQLVEAVSSPVKRIVQACKSLTEKDIFSLRWNIKRAVDQLMAYGNVYLEAVKTFIETGKAEINKRLSFHLSEVDCFNKGKAHKKYEFGRVFQLGRIAGNFMFVGACESVRMDDKKSIEPMLIEHENLFGKGKLDTLATDKGYYSHNNVKQAQTKGVTKVGIQKPSSVKKNTAALSSEDEEALYNRRSGIEPLIGHIKQGGQLGQSRMKSDSTIESSGYASVMGFNMRQVIKVRSKEKINKAA